MKTKNYIKKNYGQFIIIFVIIILAVMSLYPLFIMVMKSFKTISDDQSNPFGLPTSFVFENYQYAWQVVKGYLFNSIFITLTETLVTVFLASLAAYAFVRFNFPYKNFIFYLILSLLMIPSVLTLISQYELVNNMNLINNRLGVILPSIAMGLPFAIFLLKTFFQGVSKEIFEAASIDGANDFKLYYRIMMPLSKPIIWTLIVTQFITGWNDYLWPSLILLEKSKQTLPVGLVSFTKNYYDMTGGYGAPFAGYVISSIPLLLIFIVVSKQFVEGLTSGSIKM